MLAAVLAEGTTIIENALRASCSGYSQLFKQYGGKCKGAGTDVIRIIGVEKLSGTNYMIIPDQIEAGTYMMAGAITGGDVTVRNLIPKHMESLSAKLLEMGCHL